MHKTTKGITKAHVCGYSVLELLGVLSAIALAVAISLPAMVTGKESANTNYNQIIVAQLNAAMDHYRALYRQGYRPQIPWSAGNEAGLLAELAKPLVKGAHTIVVLRGAVDLIGEGNGIVPSDFSVNAQWYVGDAINP